MSENQTRQEQEFEANQNQTPQEPETSEALSEEDLESIAGGAHGSSFTKVQRFDNAGRLDSITTSTRSWNNNKKSK